MKVFWSWQSDTDGKIGRLLIRDALKDAIKRLKDKEEIEDAERENAKNLHLDQDIQGTTGIPDLAATIFRKIDESAVVIADVTIVGQTNTVIEAKPKSLINSNVAIELGYALKSVTDQRVLAVFNRHFGSHEDLPFDLRHKGGAITFDLAASASRDEIKRAQEGLTDDFVRRLKPFLSTPTEPTPAFAETGITHTRAQYFAASEELAKVDPGSPDPCRYENSELAYIRLIPTATLPEPMAWKFLLDATKKAPTMTRQPALPFVDRNRYGVIKFAPSNRPEGNPQRIKASTQCFRNGEIWAISSELVVHREFGGSRTKCIAIGALEHIFYDALHQLVEFSSEELKIRGGWAIECGIAGTSNATVFFSKNWTGTIREDEIFHREVVSVANSGSLDRVLLKFFDKVFDETGNSRPQGFNGFPPGRPK